jgi:hypothetical protein
MMASRVTCGATSMWRHTREFNLQVKLTWCSVRAELTGSHRRQTVENLALASVASRSSFETTIVQHLETRSVSEGW